MKIELDITQSKKHAKKLWSEMHNCAEVVTRIIYDTGIISEYDKNTVLSVPVGFGGGMADSFKGDCGALSGAVIILSIILDKYGYSRQNKYSVIRDFITIFESEYKTVSCPRLRKIKTTGCFKITFRTIELLVDYLNNFIL